MVNTPSGSRLMSQLKELDQMTKVKATDSGFCPLLSFPKVAILFRMAHPACWHKPPPGAVRPWAADVLVLQLSGHLMETILQAGGKLTLRLF